MLVNGGLHSLRAGEPVRLHSKARHPKRGIGALCPVGLVARTHAGTNSIEGRMVGMRDGDTVTLLDVDNRQYKIRLGSIDAP